MSQRNSSLKRKLMVVLGSMVLFLGIALFVLWYFPALTFHPVAFIDGPNNYSTVFETILFIRVTEHIETHTSEGEARQRFENRIADAETIIQRTINPPDLPGVKEQVLGTFINSLNERRYCVVKLKDKNVYQNCAPSLRYAVAFDKFSSDRYH